MYMHILLVLFPKRSLLRLRDWDGYESTNTLLLYRFMLPLRHTLHFPWLSLAITPGIRPTFPEGMLVLYTSSRSTHYYMAFIPGT